MKAMTIRYDDGNAEIIQEMMKILDCNVMSKAMLKAPHVIIEQKAQIDFYLKKIEILQKDIQDMKDLIYTYRSFEKKLQELKL